jgi:3-hydroxyacyl-[acyl-carrier-protein] dehydratase
MNDNEFVVDLKVNDIKKIIPHRYPFLLVDKVVYLEPGKKAVAYKNVSANEEFFQGHFPEEPVMPGVLIVEALAQTGALALLSEEKFKGKLAFFGGINKAKFRRKVLPGDVLRLETEIIKIKGPAGIGKAVAYVDDKKACEAELMFFIG